MASITSTAVSIVVVTADTAPPTTVVTKQPLNSVENNIIINSEISFFIFNPYNPYLNITLPEAFAEIVALPASNGISIAVISADFAAENARACAIGG